VARGRERGLGLAVRLALVGGGGALVCCLLVALAGSRGLDPKVLVLLALVLTGAASALSWREGSAVGTRLTGLALAVGKLARGDFNVRFRGHGFAEAGRLARQLEELSANLREGVVEARLSAIREKEARLLGRVRQKLMPAAFPAPQGWEVGGVFVAGKRGGGDFLDAFQAEQRLFLAVGSAQGAGAAAGMVMVLGRTLLREWLLAGEAPQAALRRLNQALRRQLVEGACLTLALLDLDAAGGGEVVAWGAGLQAPLYFFGRGKLARIGLEGIALGLDQGPVFDRALTPKRIELARGQRLVLATPGLCANLSPGGEEYGERRFEESMVRHGPKNTTVFVDMVAGEAEDHLEREEPDEDIVLATLKRNE